MAIWLDLPVLFHSARKPSYKFSQMTTEQAKLVQSQWHSWYKADWDFARNTTAFFCAGIGFILVCKVVMFLRGRIMRKKQVFSSLKYVDSVVALGRYAAARQFRVGMFNWYSPPLLAIIAVCGMLVWTMTLMLAPHPYYWPNSAMGHSPPIATRTGWISMGLLPFTVAFATKVNWVSFVTGTSHEKLQVYHRWSALFMYITSLVHTFPFIVMQYDMGTMRVSWNTSSFYWTGVAALVPQTYLTLLSWGVFRNRYYELFKKLHFVAAGLFLVALFIHVDFILTSWDYMIATAALYMASWVVRVGRTHYYSGLFGIPATVHFLASNTIKVSIEVPANLKWRPGQHVFVRFLGVGLAFFSSHPFSVASVRQRPTIGQENEVVTLDLVMRVKKGITRALARKVGVKDSKVVRTFVDGPYGGVPTALEDFDTVYLMSGGSGTSFILPILVDLVSKIRITENVRCRRVDVIVAVRSLEDTTWMVEDFALVHRLTENHTTKVNIHVHLTDVGVDPESKSENSIDDSSGSFDKFFGRPHLPKIVSDACQHGSGRLAFVACGPDSLLYDVRNAVAQGEKDILTQSSQCQDVYLHTENFGW